MAGRLIVWFMFLTALMSIATAQGRFKNCCRKISNTQPPEYKLKQYYKQDHSLCRLKAVVFTLNNNVHICANPKSEWTKASMEYLDKKKTKAMKKTHTKLRT